MDFISQLLASLQRPDQNVNTPLLGAIQNMQTPNDRLQNAYMNFNLPYVYDPSRIPDIGTINSNSGPNPKRDIFGGMIGTTF